jgi:hypothetical protein
MGAAPEYLLGLKRKLLAAPHGDRRGMIRDAARLLGCSVQTVYRRLAACGWKADRKVRTDRGRTCVDKATATLACGMVHVARRANGKKTLPLTTACSILEHDGKGCKIDHETGEVTMPSPTTVSRVARRYGCHPKQLKKGKPPVALKSPHPNWCWEVDASVCVVFYLPGGEVQLFDERKYYKNKPAALAKAEPARVIRWVVTDHYSGAFFLRYTQGAEDTAGLLNALIETMCRRDSENDCLYGVPEILVADKGSSVRSGPAGSLLNALKVRLITHAVGNPRAKGQVEQGQNLVETQFEGRLRMYVAHDLAELNARADEWRIAYNLSSIHTRHRHTRHEMWRRISEDQLRIPSSAEVLRDLAMSGPVEATVRHDLTITRTFRGCGRQEYDLRDLPGIMPGLKVLVQTNPFRAPDADVTVTDAEGERHIYTLSPIERTEAGFRADAAVIGEERKALKDTATDKVLKRIQKDAYGAATLTGAEKARAGKERAYAHIDPLADVKDVPLRTFIPKRGRDLALTGTLKESPPLTVVDAAFTLRGKMAALGVEWGAEHLALLRAWYPAGAIPAADMGALPDRILDAQAAGRRAEMRLVSGGTA